MKLELNQFLSFLTNRLPRRYCSSQKRANVLFKSFQKPCWYWC